jgi:hypothetical protein
MKVKALKPGFFGGSLRDVGQEFDVPNGTKGTWFVAVEDFKAPAKAKAKAAPSTLSEMAKEPATDGTAVGDATLA